MVAFDVDGTLIDGVLWSRLHQVFGISKEQDLEWLHLWEEGKLSYTEWSDLTDSVYRTSGKTKKDAEGVFSSFVFDIDAEKVVAELRSRYTLVIISSGAIEYISLVAKALAIEDFYAHACFKWLPDGRFDKTEFLSASTQKEAKVDALKDLCKRFNVQPNEIAFVGDSSNDLEAFKYTGRGILVRGGDESLRQNAWKQIPKLGDLLTIL